MCLALKGKGMLCSLNSSGILTPKTRVGGRIVLTMAKVSWLQFSTTDARWAPMSAATAPDAPTRLTEETCSWEGSIRKSTRLTPTTAPNVPVIQTTATLRVK